MKYIVEESNKKRIDSYLSEINEKYSRTFVQKMIESSNISVNGKKAKASYKVQAGDEIDVIEPEVQDAKNESQDIAIDVIYEDQDIIIVNKKKGMVVHPGNGNKNGTLVNALLYSHKDKLSQIGGVIRPGIVHRIDKDTSGLLAIAKNDETHKALSELFKTHDIKREYTALVKGIIEKERITINLPIGRSSKDRKKMAITMQNSKNAITNITVIKRYYKTEYTLINAKLETGRTHQIRVHMSYIGYPLVGDLVYGKRDKLIKEEGQCLHAGLLGFIQPSSKKYMEFKTDIPEYFKNILTILDEKEN